MFTEIVNETLKFLIVNKIQVIAVIASVVLILFIVDLIRRKRIRESYSILWLLFSGIFFFFSVWRDGLEWLAELLGVEYPPAALFLVLIVAVFLLLIQFSIVITHLSESNKKLTQKLGLLKMEVDELKEKTAKEEKINQ